MIQSMLVERRLDFSGVSLLASVQFVSLAHVKMDIETAVFENDNSDLPEEFEHMSAADIERRTRLLDNEVRVLREETQRLTGEITQLKERIRENKEKIKLNNQLPYLVSNIVEVLDINPDEEDEEDGATMDVDAQRQGFLTTACSEV
jgi:26S proteasome regulatory subunit T5